MPRQAFHPFFVISLIAGICWLAISLAPSPTDLVKDEVSRVREQALTMADKGQVDQSLRKLKVLQKTYPDQPEILIDQLQILHKAGRNTELLDLFASLELQLASNQTIDMLIQAAGSNNAGYNMLYGASLDLLPSSPYLATQLAEHLLTYKPELAATLLVEATQLAPANNQLQLLAATALQQRDHNSALKYVENYLAVEANNEQADKLYSALLIKLASEETPQEALRRLQTNNQLAADNNYHTTELLLAAWANDFVTMQSQFNDEATQPSLDDVLSISKTLRSLNQAQAAERLCRSAYARHPQDTELNIALAYTLLDQQRYSETAQIIDAIDDEQSPSVPLAKASLAEAQGEFERALDQLEQAATLAPELMLNHRWSSNLISSLPNSKPEQVSRRIVTWQNLELLSINEIFELATQLRRAGFVEQATQLTLTAVPTIDIE